MKNDKHSLFCGKWMNKYKGTKIAGFGKVRMAWRTYGVGAVVDLLPLLMCPQEGQATEQSWGLPCSSWINRERVGDLSWHGSIKLCGEFAPEKVYSSISLHSFLCIQNLFCYSHNVTLSLNSWKNRSICNNDVIYYAISDAVLWGFALFYYFVSFCRKILISFLCGWALMKTGVWYSTQLPLQWLLTLMSVQSGQNINI